MSDETSDGALEPELNEMVARREVPDALILSSAQDFRIAAQLLYDRLQEHKSVLPLLMVASFAIELYLKALNARYDYTPLDGADAYLVAAKAEKRGHPLIPLFEALDLEFRNGLMQAYFCAPCVAGCKSIVDALKIFNKTFEDCRYIFEGQKELPSIPLGDLVKLAALVGNYVESLPKRVF